MANLIFFGICALTIIGGVLTIILDRIFGRR